MQAQTGSMVNVGRYNTLKVIKHVDFGVYLDGGDDEEILLPKRFVPEGLSEGDEIEVFIYHDSDNRLIATTQKPYGQVGDIVSLKAVGSTRQGAFLDWGLMKDLFLPLSQQRTRIYEDAWYTVMIYLDEQTNRVAATQKLGKYISNEDISVDENEEVELIVLHKTDIGYKVIINNKHWGVIHFDDVYQELKDGSVQRGYIKAIRAEDIDVALGVRGYKRISGEAEKVLQLLKENDGYLPYHDKSDPEEIYDFFEMSKKAFKMATGSLYKQKMISFTKTGIQLIAED